MDALKKDQVNELFQLMAVMIAGHDVVPKHRVENMNSGLRLPYWPLVLAFSMLRLLWQRPGKLLHGHLLNASVWCRYVGSLPQWRPQLWAGPFLPA